MSALIDTYTTQMSLVVARSSVSSLMSVHADRIEAPLNSLDLARWQFGITTVYHFIFVPLTIGLAPLVAIMQTQWYRTQSEHWLRLTKFFGKLFLINFSMGVVTGIVQEFQFGMNWSKYSEFVGDVFGAPLALEALLAFFLESTFLGAWIFGWDRLSRRAHLACIWLAAIGVNLSAYFIIAANSFMQHPVGVRFNPETQRAELASLGAVLTNPTTLAAFPHVISGAFLTAGVFVAGISLWWLVRHTRHNAADEAATYRSGLKLGAITVVIAGLIVAISGDLQGKMMFQQQPMKMAAAEALCTTEQGAGFSLFAVGDVSNECNVRTLQVPGLASFLATGDSNATLAGVNDLQRQYEATYGPGDYKPVLAVTYWTFRFMIGFGMAAIALGLLALWVLRRPGLLASTRVSLLALLALPLPFLGNIFGWIFTEMGRQPWVVAPNPTGDPAIRMLTADGVSPTVNAPAVWVSMVVFTALYGALAVVWFGLMRRYASEGAPVAHAPTVHDPADDEPLSFAY